MKKIILKTENDTKKFAKDIAKSLKGGEIIALSGELGAGKTTFTQHFAKALGVKEHVNSPTFVIMRIYKTAKRPLQHLVHVDAYRLENEGEVESLGLDEYIGHPHAVVVIEWAERLKGFLKKKGVINIKFTLSGNSRKISISGK